MSIATRSGVFSPNRVPDLMNASLRAAQALAALVLGRAGLMMLTLPVPELAETVGAWVASLSEPSIRRLGLAELLMAFAIIGPSFVRIAPKLAGVAAAGLALIGSIAAVHGDVASPTLHIGFVAMMMFIAWGRGWRFPIKPHAHIRC